MKKGKVYFSKAPESPPEWYWNLGLHDTRVLCVKSFEYPYEHNYKAKNNWIRNVLTFEIDTQHSLFDKTVKEIRFINYKILSDFSLNDKDTIWWLADRLEEKNGFYNLEIDMNDGEDFTFKIKFERAETIRK